MQHESESDTTTHGLNASLKPAWWRGLTGKVLALTILFVMVGEVLIFLPSIANFRITCLKERIATAEIAALVADAAPNGEVPDSLRQELLKGAKVHIIALSRGDTRELMLRDEDDLMIDQSYDIRERLWVEWIVDAFTTMTASENRVIGVIDVPPICRATASRSRSTRRLCARPCSPTPAIS